MLTIVFTEAEHVSATEETPMIKLDSGGGESLPTENPVEHGLLPDENAGSVEKPMNTRILFIITRTRIVMCSSCQ